MPCPSPYIVKTNEAEWAVPCGRCPHCKKRRISEWVFRLQWEQKRSISSFFVTFTYANEHIPISPNNFATLVRSIDSTNKHGKPVKLPHPKSIQAMFKRLRDIDQSPVPIKYYFCGEYGSTNSRPHYHAIIFNVSDTKNFRKAWKWGSVHVGTVESSSIAYTLKYIDKEKRVPVHSRDDRLKEFSLCSKGLGENYVDKFANYHRKDYLNRNYLTRSDGVKVAMPKYYRDKIFTDHEKSQQTEVIIQRMEEIKDKDYLDYCSRHPQYDPSDFETYTRYLDSRDSKRSEDYRKYYKRQRPRNL